MVPRRSLNFLTHSAIAILSIFPSHVLFHCESEQSNYEHHRTKKREVKISVEGCAQGEKKSADDQQLYCHLQSVLLSATDDRGDEIYKSDIPVPLSHVESPHAGTLGEWSQDYTLGSSPLLSALGFPQKRVQ